MTIPFMSYLNRTGLELEEAQEVDMLTSTAQAASSWISLQASFRASGMKKLAKAEAAAIIITETVKIKQSDLDEAEEMLLLKAAVSVYAFQYQENLTEKFKDKYKLSSNLISKNKNLLKEQYEKSKDRSENKGFFEKLLG